MLCDTAYKTPHWQTDPIIWRNRQWAVTSYGIENVCGPYHYYIEKSRLHQIMGVRGDWRDHMQGKNWVDAQQFDECFAKAVEIHGQEVA